MPSEYPYPLALFGGSATGGTHYTNVGIGHQQMFNPSQNAGQSQSACQIRQPGGGWKQIYNHNGINTSKSDVWPGIWPFGVVDDQAFAYRGRFADSPDGTYELYPLVFMETEQVAIGSVGREQNTYGEIEDAFMVSGSNNSAENTITVGPDTYIVFQNIFRTTFTDFFCIKVTP